MTLPQVSSLMGSCLSETCVFPSDLYPAEWLTTPPLRRVTFPQWWWLKRWGSESFLWWWLNFTEWQERRKEEQIKQPCGVAVLEKCQARWECSEWWHLTKAIRRTTGVSERQMQSVGKDSCGYSSGQCSKPWRNPDLAGLGHMPTMDPSWSSRGLRPREVRSFNCWNGKCFLGPFLHPLQLPKAIHYPRAKSWGESHWQAQNCLVLQFSPTWSPCRKKIVIIKKPIVILPL